MGERIDAAKVRRLCDAAAVEILGSRVTLDRRVADCGGP